MWWQKTREWPQNSGAPNFFHLQWARLQVLWTDAVLLLTSTFLLWKRPWTSMFLWIYLASLSLPWLCQIQYMDDWIQQMHIYVPPLGYPPQQHQGTTSETHIVPRLSILFQHSYLVKCLDKCINKHKRYQEGKMNKHLSN